MLHVSRALKKCDWLVNDDQYSHIINPEYLNSNIYPGMHTKAIIKFKEVIRSKLNNESRAEQFYNFEENPSEALKWLPHCSVKFIENNFDKHVDKMEISLLKRLCEKSITFLEIYSKKGRDVGKAFQKTLFLLHVDFNKYLDILESQPKYNYPKFGKRATKILMTKCPDRILNKFGDYCLRIDTPTFIKYLKKEDLKKFFLKVLLNIENERNDLSYYFRNVKNCNLFLTAIPKEERFDFIKHVFIDEIQSNSNSSSDLDKSINILRNLQTFTPVYYWYQFATFEVALNGIRSMIGPETDANDKNLMFETLIASTKGDLEYAKCVLQYFHDKHINSSLEIKKRFLINFILKLNTHTLDKESWKILEDIINTMDIYQDSQSYSTIIEAVLIYKILHNEIIPDEIVQKFQFNSLKTYQGKLNSQEKDMIFNYLHTLIWNKLQNIKITSVSEFEQCVNLLKETLTLLKDWGKNILDYPLVLDKIRHLIKIKQEKSWTLSMLTLYNLHKSWRKHMFDESILLNPTEEACINYLKHGPNLLVVHKHEVEAMLLNDAISLKRLLRKVRIYWPKSLNNDWQIMYLNKLKQAEGHKAITRGLCILLPRSQLNGILEKYAPKDPKIDWNRIRELELSLQRCFAKNMHIACPQPSFDKILLYAKGDYLQYALPSLLAIYYNLTSIQKQESIPKILDAPVSLQKHGIRLVFTKLPPDMLKETFSVLWKKTKNSTIRTEIFKITFNLLCHEKDDGKIKDTWLLLDMFIDNLTFSENKEIYKLLCNIDNIPESVKPMFLMKSYKFLKTLTTNNKRDYVSYEYDIIKLAKYTKEIMETLSLQFVTDIISEFTENVFFKKDDIHDMSGIISSYLLCAKDEETQSEKYELTLAPILRRSFELWNNTDNGKNYIKTNFERLITDLIHDLSNFAIAKNMIVPVKMFKNMQIEMERSLPISENYVLLRTWKLITELVILLDRNQPVIWEETCSKIAPEFGKICYECLRDDTKCFFPCIYILFIRSLEVFKNIFSENFHYEICTCLIQNEDFVQGYLVALTLLDLLYSEDLEKNIEKIHEKMCTNSSVEVKMHYYNKFQEKRASLLSISPTK
ncbi:unnamed protein product [Parnassius apollo]|uniref:(apollo) hypothetical protein n=1 Tax=Parnassius apollo TaxID=110799 RepID=A0A8S3Y146_PARAO|nr:unnamed protein product [Parnassius apollo]